MTDICACCGQSAGVTGELTALVSRDDIAVCGNCIVSLNRRRGGTGSPTVRTAIPVLVATDVAAALTRYERLGFGTEAYDDSYGFIDRDGVELHISRAEGPGRATCYLFVADTDALVAEWRAADVEGEIIEPFDTDYGIREAAYVDPDGNRIRIGSPLPSWPAGGCSAGTYPCSRVATIAGGVSTIASPRCGRATGGP